MIKASLLVGLAALLAVQLSPAVEASSSLLAPSLISPFDNALVGGAPPTFTWSSVPGADNYELQYSADNSFLSALTVSIHNIRDDSILTGVLDGAYYWRIRAGRDNGDVGPWSPVWVFTLDTIPPKEIELISPEGGGWLDNSTVRLDWTDAVGAENYTVLVDEDENFASPAVDVVVGVSVYTTPALSDGKYYWMVIARDLAGNENQTSARTFFIDIQPPRAPTLLTPSNGSYINDNTPTLSWEDAFDAMGIAGYEVWMDGALDFSITDNTVQAVTEYPLSDGSHSWYVVVVDRVGHENASPTWSFVVDTVPPSVPYKSGPQDGMITPVSTVTFSWSTATDNLSGLVHYELEVGDAFLENLTLTSKSMTLSDDNYSWRVRAWDQTGNPSDFENSWTLLIDTTAPSATSLLWPAENVVENTSTPQFRWTSVDDPTGATYKIQVATVKNFGGVVYDKAGILETQHDIENILPDRYSDNLEAGPFYYWRVRATDNLGHVGEWSDNLPFMVFLRDFAVSLSPSSGRVAQGGSTSALVTLSKIGGYDNSVDLSISAPPSGISYIFDRMGPPPLTATMVINADEAASPGSYTLTVKGTDANGWVRTITFSLEVYVPPTATIQEIPAGEQRIVQIDKANITQMTISARNRVQNATIQVEELAQKPEGVPALEGQVYSYISVDTENIGSNDVETVEIKFDVELSWIELRNIDVSKIRLNRYSAGAWEQLPTSKVSEGVLSVRFSAESPGLSTFAITGEEVTPPGLLPDWGLPVGVAVVVIVLVVLVVLVAWRRRGPKEFEVKGAERAPEKPRKVKEEEW